MKAIMNVKNLINHLDELKKEQKEYAEAISNLRDDGYEHKESAAIRALKQCKTIVDQKIDRIEKLVIEANVDNKEVLSGVSYVQYPE